MSAADTTYPDDGSAVDVTLAPWPAALVTVFIRDRFGDTVYVSLTASEASDIGNALVDAADAADNREREMTGCDLRGLGDA